MFTGADIQDTIRPQINIRIDVDGLLPDSVFTRLDKVPEHIRIADSIKNIRRTPRTSEVIITDTTSVCARNSIADVTFSDPSGPFRNIDGLQPVFFPLRNIEKPAEVFTEHTPRSAGNLRDGILMPFRPLHHDWLIGVIFIAAYLWLIVRSANRSFYREMTRFFLFRGINESSSRDTGALFTWQSTILNFVTFTVMALFFYSFAELRGIIPRGISSFVFMLICLGIIIAGITSRHFICTAAGSLSDRQEVFDEYLVTIYNSYRFVSILLLAIVIMLAYTAVLPEKFLLGAGITILVLFYLLRTFRLFLIFLRRKISVLYLILYLCALEILPVLILIRYFNQPGLS
jgi:hypothetical protein